MKKIYIALASTALVFFGLNANAQNNNNNSGSGFDQLIKSSPADATKLIQNYAEPLFKGFGIGLNSGWNNTAKTKKFLHFDLRISAAIAQVPVSDQSFDVTQIGLSNHIAKDPSSTTTIAPTFSGSKSAATPILDIKDNNGNKIASFTMPNGQLEKYVPAPNIQLTIGIFKNTDLTVRTTPSIDIGNNGAIGMIGFGIKHDIIQDFVGKNVKKIIPFDLAIAVNYNRINYSAGVNVTPDQGKSPSSGSSTDFSTQRITGHFSGFFTQAIISKKLLFFTPFLSIGYQTANTEFDILGNYPITNTATTYTTVTDPVKISETSVSGFRADVGFQLNLTVFRIFASYSPGTYQSVNGGIGFGF